MAYELKEAIDNDHEIILISKGDKFNFVPSNPWVMVNWRSREDVEFTISNYIKKAGINFVSDGVKKLYPDENKLVLFNDKEITYDYLIIATGPKLAFDEIEGMGPDLYSHSVCTVDHATKAASDRDKVLKNLGPVVVGAAQGASCFGPAYETALIMDTDLRKHNIREQTPITFITSEPYLGHLGLAGVGDSPKLLEEEFKKQNINWVCNAKITKIDAENIYVDEYDNNGSIKQQHIIRSIFNMILPSFKGFDAFANIEGLVNPRGFIIVDKHQANPKYPNIYSLGVCVAIPPVEKTIIPTGYMIESMVTAIASNLKAVLNGEEQHTQATLNALCFADFGDGGVAFAAIPQFKPREHDWYYEGKLVHYAKVAFEKYYNIKLSMVLVNHFLKK
ncbi:Sulfide-quinone reductase [Francisella orientalis]|uniref:Sulfide-quinone reductase n=1 Tax=Francisella orientalis TaxID=299583 RepID=A0ABM5U893_9GAMM|nr:NADH dehydrogenase, FAD-containing subunit [Francisella orientalis str. Toba 04]AKN86354.1 Sulfide-quinone reductase [Francisella orientalis FNO12]AKN87892.1 Sulfide-quinone reductase [Francisella orientalis FNO24]AKN89431.1 Sulfide-quinone reductase [Francisella orientalis]AKU06190.1 Sulfide-quinone reductase [Francisella orientalis]